MDKDTLDTLLYVLKIFGFILAGESAFLLIIFFLFPERFLKIGWCNDCCGKLIEIFCCRYPEDYPDKVYPYQNYCGILGCICGCGIIPGIVQCICEENPINKGNWFMHFLSAVSRTLCCCCKHHQYRRKHETVETTPCDVCCFNCLCCTNDRYYCCCENNYGVPAREYGCCDAPIARSNCNNSCKKCCNFCCCTSGNSAHFNNKHGRGEKNSHLKFHFKYGEETATYFCCAGCTLGCCMRKCCPCGCGCGGGGDGGGGDVVPVGGCGDLDCCCCCCDGCNCDCGGGDCGEGAVYILLIFALVLLALFVAFSIFIFAYVIINVITADTPEQVKIGNQCCNREFAGYVNEAPGWRRVEDGDYSYESSDEQKKKQSTPKDIEAQFIEQTQAIFSGLPYNQQQQEVRYDPTPYQQNNTSQQFSYVAPPQPSQDQYQYQYAQPAQSPYEQQQPQPNSYDANQPVQTPYEPPQTQSEQNAPEEAQPEPQKVSNDAENHDTEQVEAPEQNDQHQSDNDANENNDNEEKDPYDL